jgi:hypothetical protein
MVLTVIFNAILALGVIVMVVTPLGWAILTQHRDHAHPAPTDGPIMHSPPTMRSPQSRDRQPSRRPQYKPVGGRA